MSINSILEKLTKEEINELSEAINKNQKDFFGNSLKRHKQEKLMAQIFNKKDWNTLIGSKKDKKHDPKSDYQRTVIEVEVLSNGFYNDPNDLGTIQHDITYGDCSGSIKVTKRESLSMIEACKALDEQGSDPAFLIGLDESVTHFLDFIWHEIQRQLKYNHTLEDSNLEEQIELMYDKAKSYNEYKDYQMVKDDIEVYLYMRDDYKKD